MTSIPICSSLKQAAFTGKVINLIEVVNNKKPAVDKIQILSRFEASKFPERLVSIRQDI